MSQRREYEPMRRFSDRVDDYDRYRPGYPPELIEWLFDIADLEAGDCVADVGSGTGLLSGALLQSGLQCFGVEPNAPMRAAAERRFGGASGFRSVDGTAEQTSLASGSVKLVSAAQAFHWFDPAAARAEFSRVLQHGGGVALIWNVRRVEDAFAQGYEALLLKHCRDYADGVPTQADPETVAAFFGPAEISNACFDYAQRFDFEGLRGRLLSSSYTPKEGDPAREPLLDDLRNLFETYAHEAQVSFEYDTRAFFGRL